MHRPLPSMILSAACGLGLLQSPGVMAQPIVPATDGTQTQVIPTEGRYDITGGTVSGDGANLFHSFERFGLSAGEVANFISQPAIQNILGRVVGGQASVIDGLIQVSGGGANLYLINSAGMLLGPNAALSLDGGFTATTASGVAFNQSWLPAVGSADYSALVGAPTGLGFRGSEGTIVNSGSLQVAPGEAVRLVGGAVINTGTIEAPGGEITIAAVPGENLVRISQQGSLISLELATLPTDAPAGEGVPVSLPALLAPAPPAATGMVVDTDGTVRLAGPSGTTVPDGPGVAITAGRLSVADQTAGDITVVGNRVALVDAQLNASGTNGGGTVRIGGDRQGQGSLPGASRTVVNAGSSIQADALGTGNGGAVIVWSDEATQFLGNITARGGTVGDGGFVEVSGRQFLDFRGQVDTSARQGGWGTLLLDPTTIRVVAEGGLGSLLDVDDALDPDLDLTFAETTIDAAVINAATAQVVLAAEAVIRFEAPVNIAAAGVGLTATANLIDVLAPITTNGGAVQLSADNPDFVADAGIDVRAAIATNGGDISLTGFSSGGQDGILLNAGSTLNSGGGTISLTGTCTGECLANAAEGIILFNATVDSGGGDISLEGASAGDEGIQLILGSSIKAGAGQLTLTADQINLIDDELPGNGGGILNGTGGLLLQPQTAGVGITIGGASPDNPSRTTFLNNAELAQIQDGFASITLGRADSSGLISLAGDLTFTSPLILQAPAAGGAINTTGGTLTGEAITLGAAEGVTTGALVASGDLTIRGDEDVSGSGAISIQGPVSTTGGDVALNGASNIPSTEGVEILGAINSGGGDVTLTGAATSTGSTADGVSIQAPITTEGGSLTVTGTSSGADGIYVTGAAVSTGGGEIRFDGTSASSDIFANGINLDGANFDSAGGAVALTGTALGTTDTASGIDFSEGGIVSGGGPITLTGNSAGDDGVFSVDVAISSGGGDVRLRGTSTGAFGNGLELSGGSVSSGGGDMQFTGSSANFSGIASDADIAAGEGAIAFTADSFSLLGRLSGTQTLTLLPATKGSPIVLGDVASGGFSLNSTTLGATLTGFSEIVVGRAGDDNLVVIGDGTAFDLPTRIVGADQIQNFSDIGTWTITGADGGSLNGIGFDSVSVLFADGGENIFTFSTATPFTPDIISFATQPLQLQGTTDLAIAGDIISDTAVTVTAAGDIQVGNIQSQGGSPASITIQSDGGDITTADLTTAGGNVALGALSGEITAGTVITTPDGIEAIAGGDVIIEAGTAISTGNIVTASAAGAGGNVLLDPSGDIEVGFINATGLTGGTIDITTGRFFRAAGSFIDANGETASISTARNGGNITITHGGGPIGLPFIIGDASLNGTAAAITSGTFSVNPVNEIFLSFNAGEEALGRISILTDALAGPPPVANPPLPCEGESCNNTDSPLIPTEKPAAPDQQLNPVVITAEPTRQAESGAVSAEADFTSEFDSYLGFAQAPQPFSLEQTQKTLQTVRSQTGRQPAIVFVTFGIPKNGSGDTTLNDANPLELILVSSEGDTIYKQIPETSRREVLDTIERLRRQVVDPNLVDSDTYLTAAQRLHRWLIDPIEADLQAAGINHISFVMPAGLRLLPLAVLHNGEQFLVERYSLGLLPSVSLTDLTYRPLQDATVLVGGASQFATQTPLPAVTLEMELIQSLWPSQQLAEANFTTAALKRERQQTPYPIIHLATHGEFLRGAADNSYLQFYDGRLQLNQLRELGWNAPPVELVSLSACQTALGNREAELGFAGLAVASGARSVVASLWQISDASTAGLMAEFYRQLQRGDIKAESLRQAQLALLQGEVYTEGDQMVWGDQSVDLPRELVREGRRDFSHPYFWSAFTLVGSPW